MDLNPNQLLRWKRGFGDVVDRADYQAVGFVVGISWIPDWVTIRWIHEEGLQHLAERWLENVE